MDVDDAITLAMRIATMAAQIIAEDDAADEQIMMAIRIAAEEVVDVMALEEEDGLDILEGEAWSHVTVRVEDFHEMSDKVFRLHFRMGKRVFDVLCQTLQDHLLAQGRLRRTRTPFRDIMLMVIWLLATPDSFRSVALRFGVSPGTLYYFYTYIIEALREMAPQYISWPSAGEREHIEAIFSEATGFPGVIGSIDGTHVYITAPLQNAAYYINRYQSYSINVQAVVDHNLQVRDIHVGEVGSMNDSRVFDRSPLSQSLLRGEGILPDQHLVGDGAYTLTNFMMIPFRNNGHLTGEQLRFNKRLSQCRVRVENAFARAKGKWRRLKFLHARNQDIVTDHIVACFVLHNFLILNGEPMLQPDELERPINNNQILGNEGEEGEGVAGGEQLNIAMAMGLEKRAFIMNEILVAPEDE